MSTATQAHNRTGLILLAITFFFLLVFIVRNNSLPESLVFEKAQDNMCRELLRVEFSELINSGFRSTILRPKLKLTDNNSVLVCFLHITEYVAKYEGDIFKIDIYRNGELLEKNVKNNYFYLDNTLPSESPVDYTLAFTLTNDRIFTSEPELLQFSEPERVEVIFEIPLVSLLTRIDNSLGHPEKQTVVYTIQKTLEQLEYAALTPALKQDEISSVQLKFRTDGYEILINSEDGLTYTQESLVGPFVHIRFGSPFSGHGFFWDEAITAWYFLKLFPDLSRSTLDFWYALQIEEGANKGLIPREIRVETLHNLRSDNALLQRNINPISYIPLSSLQVSNPFFLSKVELDLYRFYKDKQRLETVYPKLEKYFLWIENNRKNIDEETNCPYYEFSNLGSGMDNIMRGFGEFNPQLSHYGWVDVFAQQVMLAQDLRRIQIILNIQAEQNIPAEVLLQDFVRCHYDPEDQLFWDRSYEVGFVKNPNSIAFVWVLFIDFGSEEAFYHEPIFNLLSDTKKFGGYPGIPSVARDDPLFHDNGNYWQGGIWPPMNWVSIKGLESSNNVELKKEIMQNTICLVNEVFDDRKTVYEYYSPALLNGKESPGTYHGMEARRDFYGWGSIVPALLLD